MVDAVSGNTVRVNVGNEEEKIVVFWTDDKTSVSGDEKQGTLADLEAGQKVTVKARNGHADSIDVDVKGEGDGKDKKHKGQRKPSTEPASSSGAGAG